ncbi:inorganic polyphosphate/ATP-NAD kinase [Halostagnicola larsenii XH-48]|uniref:NAD kinase n=1 Tax=Halostagnicola larsenii XH-48 TaxID=797299 RepID=W0JMT3_9EURY|nr:NAD(+)/NADH kinase [Halostagnicola larsenii]AHF98479.1 inorganic polyphosphate/ATP-NAD kinase [Halostagnicola larsenii XH-48]
MDAEDEVTVGIVAQRNNDRAQSLATQLVDALERNGVAAAVDDETGAAIGERCVSVAEMNGFDLVVSIGGDGTFLFVAREAGGAPIVGVNLGEVGFLNAVAPENAVEAVTALVAERHETGEIGGRAVKRLRASGEGWTLEPALNEVVVHGPKRGSGGGATIDIRVDGQRYAESHADGVLVATPTGSTAYNLSEGGPLVRPSVDALVVTQMAAADPMPPLVIDNTSELTLTVRDAETAYAISDGRNRQRLEPPASVTVTTADDPVTLAGPPVNFFGALEKLE